MEITLTVVHTGNGHGFVLNSKSYQQEQATEPVVAYFSALALWAHENTVDEQASC